MKLLYYFLTIASILNLSCTRTYYISPNYGNSIPYHTLSLQKDSIKSSLYLNGSLMYGGANYNLHDEEFAAQFNLYNTNQFNLFKLWYGAGLTLGDYIVHRFDSTNYPDFYTTPINKIAGGKFFGSIDANAGIVFTIPLGNKAEWRVLGLQASAQNEYGNYLSFRKKLIEDTIYATGIAKSSFLLTVGFSTEFSFEIGQGVFNIFQQYNILTGNEYKFNDLDVSLYDPSGKRYSYYNNTYAYSLKNTTVFLQNNIGRRLINFQIGVNYRLSKSLKK